MCFYFFGVLCFYENEITMIKTWICFLLYSLSVEILFCNKKLSLDTLQKQLNGLDYGAFNNK